MEENNYLLNGNDIKNIRNKNNMTIAELAKVIDVSEQTVIRWEKNERTCKGKYAAKVKELDKEWIEKESITNGKISFTIDFNSIENKLKRRDTKNETEDEKVIIKEINIINNVNNLYM